MEIYVLTAWYRRDDNSGETDHRICGIAENRAMADKIMEAVRESSIGTRLRRISCIRYDTDDYMPLEKGLKPYKVTFNLDKRIEIEQSLFGFSLKNEDWTCRCVYAKDEAEALKKTIGLKAEYLENQKRINKEVEEVLYDPLDDETLMDELEL